ncbi:GH36-type glycosyl hydrolase domain-containing protein [Fervidicella metallireducens]|uniref:GH36-type glycosyl hydrolase domain-containing protein n=1 Tax=Fervidicella metallireducens TaxID=655338 RepID=UPI000AE5BBAC|nr:glucoamylase family protein [Fervidicella metallireducens]
MAWERKRGAIVELNNLIKGDTKTTFSFISSDITPLKKVKYIITLDADTIMPIGTARKLIGTISHPLNEAIVDKDKGIVTGGYGLIQPRIAINIESSNKTLFSRIFAGCGGVDPYSTAVSDVYQDLFGEGIFTGKGIYNVDVFREVLNTSIPENTILSHDLLEGSYLRVGLATDIQLYDGYPEKYSSYILRLHRWVRGDWQLIRWLFPYVKNRFGKKHKNPLTPLSKWKIFDNLRRSLVSTNILLLVSFSLLTITNLPLWLMVVFISPILFHLLLDVFDFIILKYYKAPRQRLNGNLIYGFKAAIFQGLLNLIMLPYHSYMMVNAILKTLYRVFISKNNLLEWVTAAEVEKNLKNDFKGFIRRMYSSVIFSLILLFGVLILKPENTIYTLFFTGLWVVSPYVAFYISKPSDKMCFNLTKDELKYIREISLKTWYFYEEFSGEDNNFLPVDNYQETPVSRVAHRTSPTNIGFLLLSILSARDLGYISLTSTIKKLNNTITTIEKMEKWNGHLYNWYDTKSLEVLHPRYVSTVDSGNLVGYYITLVEGIEDILKAPIFNTNILMGIIDTIEHSNDYNKDLLKELKNSFPEQNYTPKFYFEIFEKIKGMLNEDVNPDIKLKNYIDELLLELNNIYPSILYKMDTINFINNHDEFNQLGTILGAVSSNSSPKDLSKIYETILSNLDLMLNECKDSANKEFLLMLKPEIIRVSDNLNSLIDTAESVKERVQKLCDETLFKPLYDEKRGLFSIGYNVDENKLTESYYDLLASEARLTSYIAAVRGEVPVDHWFRLGRSLTLIDGFRALVSWTGTMFEYLMPALIMKNYDNTLLDETYETAIKSQIKYGKLRHLPWGTSESGYYTFDLHLNYQYKAFGVPELGLKRGLIRDMVISPYSTLLALPFAPNKALENIKRLISLNLEGKYGLYEAADFTPERLSMGNDFEVVKSYMAHHQGMIMLSINNFINNNIMIKRFHSSPLVRCGEFMLHEKTPLRVIITKEYKETVEPFRKHEYEDIIVVRNISSLDNPLPVCHLLSNGSYSILLTNGGSGYCKNGDIQVTRWREDSVSRKYGSYFFIRELNSNKVWSSTFEPINKNPDQYNVKFSQDKAEYHRTDENIETHQEICVSPEDNCEIRKITIKNNAEKEIIIECTSYIETVLSPQMADIAHPAFNNLFIRTEYIKDVSGIISSRRPREEHKETLWAYHSLTVKGNIYGDYEFETNRNKFIGRGRDISNPLALNHPLSGTIGPVLDPIMSLRGKIKIEPGKSAVFSFTTGTAKSKEEAKDLMSKYHDFSNIERAFELAYMRSQMELKYLNLSPGEIETYDNMISHILFLSPIRKKFSQYIAKNKKGQSGLWAYGISGDVPIVLVTIKKTEDIDVIKDMLRAHDYWSSKGLKVDLVILNEDESSYLQPLEHLLREVVLSTHARNILDRQGGIFIRNAHNMPEEDVVLLYSVSRLIIKAELGQVKKQIELHDLLKPHSLAVFSESVKNYSTSDEPLNLLYFNGYGGFDEKNNEYVIRLKDNINTPAPWINVVSNENCGFIVTESGSGYTWCENSRENKLTPWSNDPVSDTPSEIIYIRDDDTGEVFTITPLPIREKESYTIRHGFGYSLFNHNSHGIKQNLTVFVPRNDNIKISMVKLENDLNEKRKLSIFYYIRPVLGVSEQITQQHLISEFNDERDCILIKNPYNADFPERMVFVDSSLNKLSYTCDRLEFLGQYGHLDNPQALKFEKLSNTTGAGFDTCCVLQNSITLEAGSSIEFVYLFGQIKDIDNLKYLLTNYKNINTCKNALNEIKDFWRNLLSVVNVETPDTTMNLMLNSWLLYQTLICRIWARSAFYQSGGAYGYRDQLQDVMSLMYSMPSIARNQILLHCAHQFVEGDVQHWWHPGAGDKGIRTRFSDDLVWLPYVTSEYVKVTGDFEVLREIVNYLEDEPLREGEDERYGIPRISEEKSSVYEHCIRAIERSLKFGEHGIPLMGSGDWNDGMSTVGNKGKGESVWLGWFIYTTLNNFIPICREFKDFERVDKYLKLSKQIIESIEKNAWDGEWYRRAYFDDGTPLGSSINKECKIDSLAQSWAAISDGADKERVLKAMSSVENYLIKEEAGLILLFTPPFDEGDLRPGYIRGYVPGVRENGGQYTHASTWVIYAFAKLGYGDKAHQYFNLINPINHSITQMDCSKYKVEPYVVAADVYSIEPHTGRGGWTWYTGSSGWMYRVGLEQILGFKKEGNKLIIDPCIPKEWREFKIYYRFGESRYNITVVNPYAVNRGVKAILVDNKESNFIELKDDKNEHQVVVTLG